MTSLLQDSDVFLSACMSGDEDEVCAVNPVKIVALLDLSRSGRGIAVERRGHQRSHCGWVDGTASGL